MWTRGNSRDSLGGVERTRIFLIDDQRVFVEALELSLSSLANVAVVGSAGPADADVADAIGDSRPDVVAVDVDTIADSVETLAARFAGLAPDAVLVVLTSARDTELAVRAAMAGFDGWVSKDSSTDELLDALRAVCQGQVSYPPEYVSAIVRMLREEAHHAAPGTRLVALLSAREHDVLAAMVDGANSVKIADLLHLSRNTVRTHMRHIFRKLRAHSALEVVKIARDAGIEPTSSTTYLTRFGSPQGSGTRTQRGASLS